MWFWPALVVAVAASAALLVLTHQPIVAPHTQITLATAVAAAWAAAAAVAWSRYRSSSDPHLLFVSAGCGALVVGTVVYGIAFSFAIDLPQVLFRQELSALPSVLRVSPLPVVGWQVAWAVAGACFVLALPWRDRRGKTPVSAATVLGYTTLATGASIPIAAFVAEALQDGHPWKGFNIGLPGLDRFALGPVGWFIGGAAALLLVVAAWREAWRGSNARGVHPCLAGALLVAAPMQLGVIHHPLQGMGFLTWADALQPLVPALVLAGLLLSQREEISRVRRATDRATDVLSGRAEIASTLAHDLRSPIATVKSLAATTTQNYDRLSDAERTEFLSLIEHEAGRLLDTVNQASLALKVDAGTLVDDRRPLDLATVVREAIESADTTGHYLTAELAPGLTVEADRKNLAEAVRQVIDNAAKFSPPDAPIRVSSAAAGPLAVVEVADGGPGIPEDRRHEVFGRFARWRPVGYEDRPGTGLGLFIARGIFAEHGGEMETEGAPAGGTIVRIRLPLEAET